MSLEVKLDDRTANISFLERILDTDDFKKGKYNTHFIEKNKKELMSPQKSKGNFEDIAIIAASIDFIEKVEALQPKKPTQNLGNSWKDFGRKRSILRLWK